MESQCKIIDSHSSFMTINETITKNTVTHSHSRKNSNTIAKQNVLYHTRHHFNRKQQTTKKHYYYYMNLRIFSITTKYIKKRQPTNLNQNIKLLLVYFKSETKMTGSEH